MDLRGGIFRCSVRTTTVLVIAATGREVSLAGAAARRSAQLAVDPGPFQGAQDHPQISAACQEGLGDHRVTTRAGTWAFLSFSIKNESIQGTCCEPGTRSAFLVRRRSTRHRPGGKVPLWVPFGRGSREAQRGEVICPRPHSWAGIELGWQTSAPDRSSVPSVGSPAWTAPWSEAGGPFARSVRTCQYLPVCLGTRGLSCLLPVFPPSS